MASSGIVDEMSGMSPVPEVRCRTMVEKQRTKQMKTIILVLAFLISGMFSVYADPIDVTLGNRETMVAAVALLSIVPPPCTVDHKKPDPIQVYKFITLYGYEPDDQFLRDVRMHVDSFNGPSYHALSKKDKDDLAESLCGLA